jgi:hypothetical protein
MCDNRELAVCLLDLELGGISLHTERIIVSIAFPSAYLLYPCNVPSNVRGIRDHVAGVDVVYGRMRVFARAKQSH